MNMIGQFHLLEPCAERELALVALRGAEKLTPAAHTDEFEGYRALARSVIGTALRDLTQAYACGVWTPKAADAARIIGDPTNLWQQWTPLAPTPAVCALIAWAKAQSVD